MTVPVLQMIGGDLGESGSMRRLSRFQRDMRFDDFASFRRDRLEMKFPENESLLC